MGTVGDSLSKSSTGQPMRVRTCHSTDVSKYKLALKELEVERIHALEGMRPHA